MEEGEKKKISKEEEIFFPSLSFTLSFFFFSSRSPFLSPHLVLPQGRSVLFRYFFSYLAGATTSRFSVPRQDGAGAAQHECCLEWVLTDVRLPRPAYVAHGDAKRALHGADEENPRGRRVVGTPVAAQGAPPARSGGCALRGVPPQFVAGFFTQV